MTRPPLAREFALALLTACCASPQLLPHDAPSPSIAPTAQPASQDSAGRGSSRLDAPLSLDDRSFLAALALADELLTGTLHIPDPKSTVPFGITIGSSYAYIGVDGLSVAPDEIARTRSLVGMPVVAGIARGRWPAVIGSSSRICIALEHEVRPIIALRDALTSNPRWRPDALVRETGAFEALLAQLPTEEGAWVDSQVGPLLTINHTLAGDIAAWYARTIADDLRKRPTAA